MIYVKILKWLTGTGLLFLYNPMTMDFVTPFTFEALWNVLECITLGWCHWDRLCRECQTLIEHHDQIKLLSNARNNLNMTLKVNLQQCLFWMMVDLKFLEPCSHTLLALLFHLQDVEGMMSISTEAAEARASLEDEKELLHTFEVSYWLDLQHAS